MLTRDAAQILHEFTKSESLRKHALAVEACVAAYARKLGEDEKKWSVTALLHDFDWEIHPALPDHPTKGEPILAARGVQPGNPPRHSFPRDSRACRARPRSKSPLRVRRAGRFCDRGIAS